MLSKKFEVISGKSIAKRCKHIFAETFVENGKVIIKKNYNIFENLQHGDSIFVKTDSLPEAFNIMSQINKRVKLVTHESDYVINDAIVAAMPKNIDRLFSINVVTTSDKVVPIPLGIANDYCKITLKPNKIFASKKMDSKAIISCNIANNVHERAPLYSTFIDDLVSVQNPIMLAEYEKLIKEFTFIFCPEGNGPDTHRLWESLYFGKIPILKRSIWNKNFRDLPIMFTDSLLDANKKERDSFLKNFDNSFFNVEKLNADFWGDLINV